MTEPRPHARWVGITATHQSRWRRCQCKTEQLHLQEHSCHAQYIPPKACPPEAAKVYHQTLMMAASQRREGKWEHKSGEWRPSLAIFMSTAMNTHGNRQVNGWVTDTLHTFFISLLLHALRHFRMAWCCALGLHLSPFHFTYVSLWLDAAPSWLHSSNQWLVGCRTASSPYL